jgi:hypothetical protein
LIIGRTVRANLSHYSTVGSSFAMAFGLGFSFNNRWRMLPVRPRRVPLYPPGCIVCPTACGHDIGEIYNGEYCARIVGEFKILGLAVVTNPLQKYSVLFLTDPKTGEKVDHYNYATVEYLAKRWPMPFSDWDVGWTRRLHPKSKFGRIARNDRCSCESGKKYKKCCANLDGIMRPHVIFDFHFPIAPELQTNECSY